MILAILALVSVATAVPVVHHGQHAMHHHPDNNQETLIKIEQELAAPLAQQHSTPDAVTRRNAFTDDLLNDLKQLGTQIGLTAVQSSTQILGHLLSGLNGVTPATKRDSDNNNGQLMHTITTIENELAQILSNLNHQGHHMQTRDLMSTLQQDLANLLQSLTHTAVEQGGNLVGHALAHAQTALQGVSASAQQPMTKRNAFTDDLLNDLKQLGAQLGLQAVQSSSQLIGHLLTGLDTAAQPSQKRDSHYNGQLQHTIDTIEHELAEILSNLNHQGHNIQGRDLLSTLQQDLAGLLQSLTHTAVEQGGNLVGHALAHAQTALQGVAASAQQPMTRRDSDNDISSNTLHHLEHDLEAVLMELEHQIHMRNRMVTRDSDNNYAQDVHILNQLEHELAYILNEMHQHQDGHHMHPRNFLDDLKGVGNQLVEALKPVAGQALQQGEQLLLQQLLG